jgi:hypothetical protein
MGFETVLRQEDSMNLSQIIETLPPRVYLRSGELVIHFSTPGDLVARVTETQAALSAIDRTEAPRSDTRTRGKANGRLSSSGQGEATGTAEAENCAPSAGRTADGKED